MKVLIVTHDANFSGGANRSLYTNIKVLKDQYGIDFLVLLPSADGALNKKLDEISVPWISTRYYGVVSGLRHDGKDVLRKLKVHIGYYLEKIKAKIIAKRVASEGIDLVYTNTRLPMIGANIAELLGVPHVSHVREFGTVEPLWGHWDFNAMYNHCDKIVLISYALQNQFLEHVPSEKLIVSQNGIDYNTVEFQYNDLSKNELHILVTGRLVPDKAQEEAILAIDYLIKNNLIDKKIFLHLVGSSPKRTHIEWYEKKLRDLVDNLGIKDNVIFHGELSDMPGIRKGMDIEIMCAICETFGRVTVEAMRAGLMVIGSNTGGTLEIIQDKTNGYLYQQGDPVDLANKIKDSISDVKKFNEIRKTALEYASRNFTVQKNCKEIYDIMCEVIDGDSHR